MNSLKNHLLIAMPSLQDKYFKRSVTYLCEHDEEGAMGLIINQPIGLDLDDLLKKMKLQQDDFVLPTNLANQVLLGGPVTPDRGFVLHSGPTQYANSRRINDQLTVTCSKDVLDSFGSDQAPEQYLVALGYAGWEAGQLEQEIQQGSWLTIPAEPELLFEVPHKQRWETATKRLGIDIWQLSGEIGHA
ncbi:YqgE/AlgH family protein [Ferrimonas kyonanensis]|uniref:YqgE/AlgH family protein n=1 Tax=Ferrimonas kyonanensis TaxID=364763 RepID=UPI0003F57FDD|nr:YqgE/AlgH family protein [Ferrimonas kyonanensis]